MGPEDHTLAGLEHSGGESTVTIDLKFRDWNNVETFEMPADEETITQEALVGAILSEDGE